MHDVCSRKTSQDPVEGKQKQVELDLDLVRVDLGRFPQIGVNTRNLCVSVSCALLRSSLVDSPRDVPISSIKAILRNGSERVALGLE